MSAINETLSSDHPSIQGVQSEHHTVNGISILTVLFRPVIVKGASSAADAVKIISTGKP